MPGRRTGPRLGTNRDHQVAPLVPDTHTQDGCVGVQGRVRGSNPYSKKEWKKARLAALEEADGRCRVCDVKRKRMEVDHRLGVKNDPEHRHLTVLCSSCHSIKTTISRRTRTPYTKGQLIHLYRLALETSSVALNT